MQLTGDHTALIKMLPRPTGATNHNSVQSIYLPVLTSPLGQLHVFTFGLMYGTASVEGIASMSRGDRQYEKWYHTCPHFTICCEINLAVGFLSLSPNFKKSRPQQFLDLPCLQGEEGKQNYTTDRDVFLSFSTYGFSQSS